MTAESPAGKRRGASADSKPPSGAGVSATTLEQLNNKITTLAKTNRQLKRQIFDLYTIIEISRHFNSVLDYETLLDTFILTSMAQVGASKAAIFLPGRGHPDRLVMIKHRGSAPFPDRRQFFKLGSKLVTYVTKLNRPVVTGELIGEMARRGENSILRRFHPGLVVPLVYQSRLTGMLILSDKMSGREFQMEDTEFLSVLGSQISVAIENTRLYDAEKMATQQLRSAQEQLVHTERLAALGEMSAKVAHEINNPLGIIKNYIQLTRRVLVRHPEAADYAEAADYTDIVAQEIDRIARIVCELLDFHRPRGLSFRKIDVVRVMDDVLALTERKLDSRRIVLTRSFGPDCPQVMGSAENLKQVFINVIINALDVMENGGTFEVGMRSRKGHLLIEFSDSGPGIEPELIPRIFEPFFTTKEPGKGTGLGLSVCYGIIKKHGGSITYHNTGKGGCFTIELPAATHGNREDEHNG